MDEIREEIKYMFPVKKGDKNFCPKCDVELDYVRDEHHIGLDGRGTRGTREACPKCKRTFYTPYLFID